jgi:hypothetical protein
MGERAWSFYLLSDIVGQLGGQRRDFRLPTQIRNFSQIQAVISFIAGIPVTFVMQS